MNSRFHSNGYSHCRTDLPSCCGPANFWSSGGCMSVLWLKGCPHYNHKYPFHPSENNNRPRDIPISGIIQKSSLYIHIADNIICISSALYTCFHIFGSLIIISLLMILSFLPAHFYDLKSKTGSIWPFHVTVHYSCQRLTRLANAATNRFIPLFLKSISRT